MDILGEAFNYNAILDDYQIIEEIGKGGFGTVMLARHKEDKKEVAIKFMDISENCKLIGPFSNDNILAKIHVF